MKSINKLMSKGYADFILKSYAKVYSQDWKTLDKESIKKEINLVNTLFKDLVRQRQFGFDFEFAFGSFGNEINELLDEACMELYDHKTDTFIPIDYEEILDEYGYFKSNLYECIRKNLRIK